MEEILSLDIAFRRRVTSMVYCYELTMLKFNSQFYCDGSFEAIADIDQYLKGMYCWVLTKSNYKLLCIYFVFYQFGLWANSRI